MSGPLGKQLPNWLEKGRCIAHTSPTNRKAYERSIRYYQQRFQATPDWLSEDQKQAIRDIYRECKALRKQGKNVVVDHIVPLISPYVCGLEAPWNLQIISESENARKGNKEWPGKAGRNMDMFRGFEPQQLSLAI